MNLDLQTIWVDSIAAVSADVLARCFPPSVEGSWWYTALEAGAPGDQFRFSYLVLQQTGKSVGVVPAFTMDLPLDLVAPPLARHLLQAGGRLSAWLRYQRTFFVGSPCADEGLIALPPEWPLEQCLPVIVQAVRQRAAAQRSSLVVWKDVPAAYWSPLDRLVSTEKFFRIPSFPGTKVDLPSGGFDAYLKTLDSENRYKLRKKLRQSHAQGDLEVTCTQHPGPAELQEIFALYLNTWRRGKTKFERLTPEFFRAIAAAPACHFLILREKTRRKMVAFMLLFRCGWKAINKFIGLDYDYAGDWFMYFRLWEEAVRWATATGARELQSGQTGYFAKRDLGHKLVPLVNYCRHRNRLLHTVMAAVSRSITWRTLDDDLPERIAAPNPAAGP